MLVRWTQPAADDLLHICDYTAERFGAAQARRVADAIYESAASLHIVAHLECPQSRQEPVVFTANAQEGARKIERWAFYFARETVEAVNGLWRAA